MPGTRSRARNHCWQQLRSQRGAITLMELLVAMPAALVVMVAAFGLFMASTRGQVRTERRAQTVVHQKNALERITRELRQASSITSSGGSHVGGMIGANLVEYSCFPTAPGSPDAPGICTRSVNSGTKATIARRVLNNEDVFHLLSRNAAGQLAPNAQFPTYITVRLKVDVENLRVGGADSADAQHPVVYEDSVELRNSRKDG